MKRLAILSAGLLSITTLTSCADPFAGATADLLINGQPGIIGETIEITVQVDGVNAEKVIVIEEQLAGGGWNVIDTISLGESEMTASTTDVIDDASTVEYRALLLPNADGEVVFETAVSSLQPRTLQTFVEENLSLSITVDNGPDDSNFFFDGDEVDLAIDANLRQGAGLEGIVRLSYQGAETQELVTDGNLGGSQIVWNVALNQEAPESGRLVLEATVTAASGQVTKQEVLDVVVANPLLAFEELREGVNSANSNAERRDILVPAAGEIFLDQSTEEWQESLGVEVIFDQPFIGEVTSYESSSGYEVEMGCAPGGRVNSFELPGRSFIMEVELPNYSFDETIFGNFDGEKLTYSSVWKMCFG